MTTHTAHLPDDLSRSIAGQQGTGASLLRTICGKALAAYRWLDQKRTQQSSMRRLRVAETISLGEKRFVSIVQVDGAQYLIGGAAGNVSLLAVLDKRQDFQETLARQTTVMEQA
jgi:flagellar biogenesis protein FliO